MKNLVPLITAVLLGLAAVFAVSKTMKKQLPPQEKMRQVLIVSSPIAKGEQLLENKIAVKNIHGISSNVTKLLPLKSGTAGL